MLILELLIIIFLFLGPGILAMFGWSTIDGESVLRSVHPIFYLLVIYSALRFKELLRYPFLRRNIVFIIFLLFIFRILFDQYIYSRLVGNLLVPLLFLFFILQVNQKERSRNICKMFFYGLFTLELVLSIYERLTHTLIFPYSLYSPEDFNGMADGGDYFRSNSLLGHPLSNALCVAVVLTFILISDLKKSYKNILLILGFTALLCFNARFAIVISFAGYFLYSIFKNKLGVKNIVYLVLTITVISLLVINLNLGDRLLSESIKSDDSSILARIDIFDIFAHFDSSLLYRGTGLDFVEKSLGLLHVENWLLIVLFDFGLITTIYFIYITVKLSYFPVQSFNKIDKVYIYGVFIVIASSNNSLATQVPVICFLMASAVFIINSSSVSTYLSSENQEALNNRRNLANNSKRWRNL